MQAIIYPSKCSGSITIPPSKSVSHRAIICACLANGISIIENIIYSEDVIVTINAMKKLGAKIISNENSLEITGISEINDISDNTVFCNESGSSLRFLMPIFSLTGKKISFTGEKSLMKRPQSIYKSILPNFSQSEDYISIEGALQEGNYSLDGNVSSQFITGLIFALCMKKKQSTIYINSPFESKSYVDLTIQTMADFGVNITYIDENTIEIMGGQKFKPRNYSVEGDYSQLGFFAVLGAINNDLKCVGIRHNSVQGDRVIVDILEKSGVVVEKIEDGFIFKKSDIVGTEIDLKDCPDLGPILMILAMFAKGKTRIYNAGRLRIKESDRIESMENELKKLGVDITSKNDEIIINGKNKYTINCEIETHNDHRIVMSLAIAGTLVESNLIINNIECVKKSYPNFFEDIYKMGINVKFIN